MSKSFHIIGLAGTNGSGKDSVGRILADEYGYMFISVSEILRNDLKKRAVNVTRESLRQLSAQWRKDSAQLGVLVDKALAEYNESPGNYQGLAIASLRNPGEVERVHELGGIVVWVDADLKIRYKRVIANAKKRGRAGEDNKTFEQFIAEEEIEMKPPLGSDDTVLNTIAVKNHCDIFLINDSSSLNTLKNDIEEALKKYIVKIDN